MKILFATSEAVPYIKTGGLADVAGALLKEFRRKTISASLVLPLHREIRDNYECINTGKSVRVKTGSGVFTGNIYISESSPDPEAYFIDCKEFFDRPEPYGTSDGDYPDNALRFAFFSRAVLEMCTVLKLKPDVIHCNDWQTGLLPLFLKTQYAGKPHFRKTAAVFTIHNLGYQGVFDPSAMKYTGLGWDYFTPERLEFYGRVNYMKAGLLYADILNTVSPTYAQEILERENGFGLDGVLQTRRNDLYGVLNGIDYREWDPASDSLIPVRYTADSLGGKTDCKRTLMKKTGLKNEQMPLLAVVSRLSAQKGLDLIADSMHELSQNGANIVILGKGEEYYHDLLTKLATAHRKNVFLHVGFEEPLSHLIYAGSDFFLMPSKYEPCGLGQLIALRYGTIPVVRKTGGLADTVRDYHHIFSRGTGFLFSDFTPTALQDAVKRALCVFTDGKRMEKMRADAMRNDYSWHKSSETYVELYKKAMKKVRT